jgi:hypothetical protein
VRPEWEDVLIPSQGVIGWQIFDICRIVELALPFDIDQVRIVCLMSVGLNERGVSHYTCEINPK